MTLAEIVSALQLGLKVWLSILCAAGVILFGNYVGLTFFNDLPKEYVIPIKIAFTFAASFVGITLGASVLDLCKSGWVKIVASRQASKKKAARQVAAFEAIDDLTAKETEILSYLVTRGERHFRTAMDGGHAAGLIGRGIIRVGVSRGQQVDLLSTPFSVDKDVWAALLQRREDFRHPTPNGPAPYVDRYI